MLGIYAESEGDSMTEEKAKKAIELLIRLYAEHVGAKVEDSAA